MTAAVRDQKELIEIEVAEERGGWVGVAELLGLSPLSSRSPLAPSSITQPVRRLLLFLMSLHPKICLSSFFS